MEMRILKESVAWAEVGEFARSQFDGMVKAVVDIERTVIALGGELHADQEAALLEDGSSQEHLWGINLYPGKPDAERIEFDSMINVRPSSGNRTRGVDDAGIRTRILAVVGALIRP